MTKPKTLHYVPGCPDCASPHLLEPEVSTPMRLVRVRRPKVWTTRGARYINGKYVGHYRAVSDPVDR